MVSAPGGRGKGGMRVWSPQRPGVVVERPELAQLLGLGVVGVQVGTVEWPAGVADPGPDLEGDRVQGAGRPGLVTGATQCRVVPPNARTRD